MLRKTNDFLNSGIITNPANYQSGAAFAMLSSFAVFSYWIELLATTSFPRALVRFNELTYPRFTFSLWQI
jgi:hypothetical protein